MDSKQRQAIFTIFAVFFIVLLPFIIMLSLGYGFDIKKGSVTNNLTVKIQTFPRNADVLVGDRKFQTPAELSVPSGQQTQIKIEKENFISEDFEFASNPNQNATARIDGLWLLPSAAEAEFQTENILSILDKNYLLLDKNGTYGIANYSFAGIRDEFLEISNPSKIKIQEGLWQTLLQNVFWNQEQGLMLYQKNNFQWEIVDLKIFPHSFVSAVSLNKNQVLLLNSNGDLWFLNLETKVISFVENNISGLAFTESPDMVWILQRDSIYRLERTGLDPVNLDLKNFKFSNSRTIFRAADSIDRQKFNNFVTKNLFLGLVFKIGNNIVYVPDSNKESYKIITNDTKSIGTSGSSIFWLDAQNNLHTYNLLTQQERLIVLPQASFDSDAKVILSYYTSWKRLFVYDQKKLFTVWIDLEINNEAILNYSPFLWLENQSCFGAINNNYQFCSQQNKLLVYKNNSFPF